MRRFARARLRYRRIPLLVPLTVAGGGLAGLWLGLGLHPLLGAWTARVWASLAIAAAAGIAIAVVPLVFPSLGRRSLRRHGTGEDAHNPTTQVIDHALIAPGCASAHSVTSIPRAGGIDHLVATPVRLWVIGTKHRPIPREQLSKVLTQIADNTTAVWDWAPPGTPVRGCLVLGRDSRLTRNQYDYGKGPVVVHTPASLVRELKAEAKLARELDERVADAVWKLGPVPG